MEIAKEKFIETFKKECDKAVIAMNPELFRFNGSQEEPNIEIISNEKISFYVTKLCNGDIRADSTFSYSGKILFGGFLDYKSIELNENEFDGLYDYYISSELKCQLSVKNKIIADGESALLEVIQ